MMCRAPGSWRMRSPPRHFLLTSEQVAARLDLRRGGVLLELEKNDMHKDDAIEVLESLTSLAESYGFSEEEEAEEGAA